MSLTKWMKKMVVVLFVIMSMCGCATEDKMDAKLRDLEFTVVAEEEQPEALVEVIEQKKSSSFQISYTLGEDLYLAIGYGEQQTGGFSISVDELYETENNIVVNTTLLGPSADEQVVQGITYPYIVIKTELLDKDVDFR
ncbi:MAG: protease complex subunit PrcB family protein [Lachnospiraceae bacterium]|nr:protease complex subunit PrcB family protein [Lachnospiraceae bacterium]MBQ6993451.1 protease complex subunit PrcB family protein [Lachnospiraceae bacterium]